MYASPRIVERKVLWENLSKVIDLHNKPWIIAGVRDCVPGPFLKDVRQTHVNGWSRVVASQN